MALIDLGKPFKLGMNDVSDSRLNAKTVTIDTDSNLFNMVEKVPGQVMIPSSTGNGFTKNQPCFRSVDDASTIIPIGLAEHTHAQYTAEEGGSLNEIMFYNIGNHWSFLGNNWQAADFYGETSGTGSQIINETISDTAAMHLESGTTANGYANIRLFSTSVDFAYKMIFMVRTAQNGPFTSYLAKFGVNSEVISEGNSNSRKSFGWESCSANANWQCWSCDGTTRSTTSSSHVVNSDEDVYEAQLYPAVPNIQFKRNHDTGTTVTKVTNIPTSGATSTSRSFQMGITGTAASASRVIHYFGAAMYAVHGDTDWQWWKF